MNHALTGSKRCARNRVVRSSRSLESSLLSGRVCPEDQFRSEGSPRNRKVWPFYRTRTRRIDCSNRLGSWPAMWRVKIGIFQGKVRVDPRRKLAKGSIRRG